MLTGDLGVRDDDGYFWFVDRADDVISSVGYRIGHGEIEECLAHHPGSWTTDHGPSDFIFRAKRTAASTSA